MSRGLFGKQLLIDVATLREKLKFHAPSLDALATTQHVRQLTNLERGQWDKLSYRELFFLVGLAEAYKGDTFRVVRTENSPFWSTFRAGTKTNRYLIGREPNGVVVQKDRQAASLLTDSDITFLESNVGPGDTDQIALWMRTENLVCLGGSKVNHGTEVVLKAFVDAGGPRVRFLWPDYARSTDVSGASTTGHRAIVIDDQLFEEGHKRILGVVARCEHPGGADGVTSIVVSGCSHDATVRMLEEFSDPNFYRFYYEGWKQSAGQPVLYFYDSAADPQWRVFGSEKPKAILGRRPKVKQNLQPAAAT